MIFPNLEDHLDSLLFFKLIESEAHKKEFSFVFDFLYFEFLSKISLKCISITGKEFKLFLVILIVVIETLSFRFNLFREEQRYPLHVLLLYRFHIFSEFL